VYDSLYVALAMLLGAPMVTADRRLYDALAAGPFAKYVAWVEDLVE
jgi:predicted nucleic acid-binding protein